jgi:hypothetical protein
MSQKEFLKKIIEQTLAKDPSLKLPVKTKEPTKPINKIPAPSAPRIGEPQALRMDGPSGDDMEYFRQWLISTFGENHSTTTTILRLQRLLGEDVLNNIIKNFDMIIYNPDTGFLNLLVYLIQEYSDYVRGLKDSGNTRFREIPIQIMSPDQKRYYELLILQLKAAFSDDAAIKQSYMDALYRYLERILGIPADGGTTSSILESFFRILFQQIVLENDQITFDVFPFENISELIEALIKYATDGPTTGGSSDEKQIEMLLQALLDQLFIGSGMVQIYLFTTVGANGEDLFTYWQNLLGVDVSEILRTQGMAGLLILLQDAGYLSYNPSSPPPFGPIEFNTDDHNPVMINQLSGYIYLWYLLTGLGSLFNNEDPF